MPRRRTAVLLTAAALALGLPAGPGTAEAATRTTPLKLLNQLRLAPETTTAAPVSFAAWGTSTVKKCRTVRVEVLAADAVGATPKNCSLNGLAWTDPFTGATVGASSRMTVERMVPPEEAWDSGASRWDARTRAAFANDVGYDGSLVAVSTKGAAKRKSREPAQWTPRSNLRCDYVTRWISVKARWGLSVDEREYHALRAAMGTYKCDSRRIPTVTRAAVILTPVPQDLDIRLDTCAELTAAGMGPYALGRDPEYGWYRDDDGDGAPCEDVESLGIGPSKDWRTLRYVSTLEPGVSAAAVAVAVPPGQSGAPRGFVHARILSGTSELWHAVHAEPATGPGSELRTLKVPSGLLIDGGSYTVQSWSTYDNSTSGSAPSGVSSATFIVDTRTPDAPSVAGTSMDGTPGPVTAVSTDPDVAALLFTTNGRPSVRIPVASGQQVTYTPNYVEGLPKLAWVNAIDRAGHVSPMTSIPAPPT